MNRRLAMPLLALVCHLAALPLLAADVDVAQLVAQLASDDVQLRRQAAEQLEKIGEPAREALRKVAKEHEDVDVRLRALVVLRAIEKAGFSELKVMGNAASYWLNRVVFSPDGQQAIASGGAVIWFDLDTGKEVRRVLERQFARNGLALSADGRHLLTGHQSDPVVRLVERETGKEVMAFKGHTGGVHAVALAPDGRLAASGGDDKSVRLWEVGSGTEVRRLEGVAERVRSLAFSADGKLVAVGSWATGNAATVRVCDAATGKERLELKGHTRDVTALKFLPDNQTLLSASLDGTVRLWDVDKGKELKSMEHKGGAYDAALSPDGKRALSAGYEDKMVRLWDLETGKEKHRFEGHAARVLGVAFSADGKRAVSCDANNTVRLWQLTK